MPSAIKISRVSQLRIRLVVTGGPLALGLVEDDGLVDGEGEIEADVECEGDTLALLLLDGLTEGDALTLALDDGDTLELGD